MKNQNWIDCYCLCWKINHKLRGYHMEGCLEEQSFQWPHNWSQYILKLLHLRCNDPFCISHQAQLKPSFKNCSKIFINTSAIGNLIPMKTCKFRAITSIWWPDCSFSTCWHDHIWTIILSTMDLCLIFGVTKKFIFFATWFIRSSEMSWNTMLSACWTCAIQRILNWIKIQIQKVQGLLA